jgi:hypothetical protein
LRRISTSLEVRPVDLGVGCELVCNQKVNRKVELHIAGLGLLQDLGDQLEAGLVKDRLADRVTLILEEGVGHAATDDHLVNFVQQIFNNKDLVGDFGTTEDRQEGSDWLLDGTGDVAQLLGHQQTCSLAREVTANHGTVGTMGSTEGIVDVNVAEGRE